MKNIKNLPPFYIAYLASSLRNWTAFVLGRIFLFMEEVEIWMPIKGYEERYEISHFGRVKSLKRSNIRKSDFLKLSDTGKAVQACLFKDGKKITVSVHRLVLEIFNCIKPNGLECCHNDGDYHNNYIGNLRWDTHKSNTADTIKHGRFVCNKGEKHGMAKLNSELVLKIKALILSGFTDNQIAAVSIVTRKNINDIRNGKRWSHVQLNK